MLLTRGRACQGSRKHVAACPNRQHALRYTSRYKAPVLPPDSLRQRYGQVLCLKARNLHPAGSVAPTPFSAKSRARQYCVIRPNISVRCSSTKAQSPTRQHDTSESDSGEESSIRHSDSSDFVPSRRALSKTVLITGGTSGIGYQIAKRVLLEGASHVRIVTRDASRGTSTVDKLRQETGKETGLDYVQAEVDAYADSKLFDLPNSPNHDPSPFNTVIHCAGITQTSLLSSTSPSAIQSLLKVNLESATLLARSFLKRYHQATIASSRRSPSSSNISDTSNSPSPPLSWHFLAISSLLANKAGAGSAVYAATKAGLIALTRAVALEGAEISRRHRTKDHLGLELGFRANVVVPGYIDTPMTESISGKSREGLIQQIPTGRFGRADEVADAVAFLLRNEYANNCVLNLDGG